MARGVDTKALVFDLVRASGRASRAGLAERTGLTGATISTLVRQLMEEGLVEESGRARSTGGKPRTFVQVVPDARYAIGIHLTRCDMVLVLANLLGAVVARTRRPCDLGSHQWSQALTLAVDELVMGAGVPRERVLGAGVVGSDSVRAEILASQQARDISLLGRPVLFDTDASAAALGEWWVSPAGSTDDALVVYLGAGIGGGYLAGGRLHRGVNQGEGELGHVCVDMAGPVCSCGARGCLEAVGGPESGAGGGAGAAFWGGVSWADGDPAVAQLGDCCSAGRGVSGSRHGRAGDYVAVVAVPQWTVHSQPHVLWESPQHRRCTAGEETIVLGGSRGAGILASLQGSRIASADDGDVL